MSNFASLGKNEIITLLQQGDKAAFKFIFDQYYGVLVDYITTYTRDRQLSEDIVQHSFIMLWQKRDRLSQIKSPKNYLYTIAYNHYVDLYRKEKRTQNLLEELRVKNLNNRVEEDRDFLEKRVATLKHIIAQLPPRCKEILYLSRQRGLEHVEIAEKLNISTKTVEEQIRIAFKKIRKNLNQVTSF